MTDKKTPIHGVTGVKVDEYAVNLLLDYMVDHKPEVAQVNQDKKPTKNAEIRDADVYFVDFDQEKIYTLLKKLANQLNKYFNYQVDGIEKAQIIHYKSPSNGYEYHIDLGPNEAAKRKISISILLNDNYEGGEMCFRTGETPSCTKPNIGDVVAFSSFLPHKVNPITKGERIVLVTWFTGTLFH